MILLYSGKSFSLKKQLITHSNFNIHHFKETNKSVHTVQTCFFVHNPSYFNATDCVTAMAPGMQKVALQHQFPKVRFWLISWLNKY